MLKLVTSTVLTKLLDPEPDPDPNSNPNQEQKFRIRYRLKKLGSSRIRIRNTDMQAKTRTTKNNRQHTAGSTDINRDPTDKNTDTGKETDPVMGKEHRHGHCREELQRINYKKPSALKAYVNQIPYCWEYSILNTFLIFNKKKIHISDNSFK